MEFQDQLRRLELRHPSLAKGLRSELKGAVMATTDQAKSWAEEARDWRLLTGIVIYDDDALRLRGLAWRAIENAHRKLQAVGLERVHFHRNGHCVCCGAANQYVVFARSDSLDRVLAVGMDCAEEKLGMRIADARAKSKNERDWDRDSLPFVARAMNSLAELGYEAEQVALAERLLLAQRTCAGDVARCEALGISEDEYIQDDREGRHLRRSLGICESLLSGLAYRSPSPLQRELLASKLMELDEWSQRLVDAQRLEAQRQAGMSQVLSEERVRVAGQILSYKNCEGFRGGEVLKITVADQFSGWRFFGTSPAGITWEDAQAGRWIEFMARVEPEGRERGFGYYKRPTKCRFIQSPEEDILEELLGEDPFDTAMSAGRDELEELNEIDVTMAP